MKLKQNDALIVLFFLIFVYIIIYLFQNISSRPDITKIYYADRITAAHKILIEKYNKLKQGKVEVIPIDFPNIDFSTNERKEVLARSLRGTGDGIDLFAVDLVWVQRFAKWCEPLGNYLEQNELKRILPVALESCYYGNKLVSVPLFRGPTVMYYREDLLKKYIKDEKIIQKIRDGITWEDFIKLKNGIKIKNPFYVFTGADYEGLICCYIELVLSQNPNYFKQNGFNLEKQEAKRALQLLVDLIHKNKLSPSIVTEFTEVPSYEYFIKNDGLFIHGWPSYDRDFKETPIDVAKESYLRQTIPPHFRNGQPTTIIGGWNLMISKFSDKKDAVFDFIKFLLSDESQEIFYKEGGGWPIVKKFYEDSAFGKRYPEIANMKKVFAACQHRPANEDYTKFSEIMSSYFEQALKNKISVDEALARATAAIKVERMMVKDFNKLSN
jgi:multiple sugar transport system substrate-binding protein